MQRWIRRQRLPRLVSLIGTLALVLGLALSAAPASAQGKATGTYRNPLPVKTETGALVESCADPSVIKGEDEYWYMYCTTDPLNDADRTGSAFNFHKIPQFRSTDLVNWTYMGDAFADLSGISWADPTAALWAPEIDYIDGTYYLFYGVTNVKDAVSGVPNCDRDNAIGYATSDSPLGPWTDSGAPLNEPRSNGAGCEFFWTYDPEVIEADGTWYIYYGSYYGGIYVRTLDVTQDGILSADASTPVQVTIANRYEGAEVIYRDDYYYLFVSATNCCNGPLTAYGVFVGRSTSPLGPFVDREGNSLLAGRVGGTPVIQPNGNRWVGPGHNTVFEDMDGQWWTIYHAVDQNDPYFASAVGFTKRPALLDAIDWVDGWPVLNGGAGPSDTPQQAPAAQEGQKTNHKLKLVRDDQPSTLLWEENFDGATLSSRWSWVRQPAAGTYGVEGGTFRFDTQAADLYVDSNNASVLTADLPNGNYIVETRVQLNLPAEGCCFNYVQAGIVIYGDDDNFIKLVHASIWETRQTEFAKEEAPVPAGYPRYGNGVVGPPSEWTYLRIVARQQGGQQLYTAYTSQDGQRWVKGGTWTHELGDDAKIGLVAMGGAGFTANFDYVRVYGVRR